MSATVADVRRAEGAPAEEHLNSLAVGIAEHLHGFSVADAKLILSKATALLEEGTKVDARSPGFQRALQQRHAFLRLQSEEATHAQRG